MSIEIEAKLKVDSLELVEQKLKLLGGEFVAEQLQSDEHFDDAKSSLKNSDRCLRLRKQQISDNIKYLLGYKGAKEKSNFKKRQEIEVEIKNAEALKQLLSAIGYESKLCVEKKRRLWRLGGCEVALDELSVIGSFVEIEGPGDKEIADVQNKLGLSEIPHIKESYACLVTGKLQQNNTRRTK
jgi:adenylate cyclase, class 2